MCGLTENPKEPQFVSAVVYLRNRQRELKPFFELVSGYLRERFEHWEMIFVDDNSQDETYRVARDLCAEHKGSFSVLRLSHDHGRERALLAGLDKSVGDFIFEFESVQTDYRREDLAALFESMKQGNDIVTLAPRQTRVSASSCFYWVFNRISSISYNLQTERCALVSRRALNTILDIDERMRSRKALLALTGFRRTTVYYDAIGGPSRDDRSFRERRDFALELIVSYSDIGSKLPLFISAFFFVLSLMGLGYVGLSLLWRDTIASGWASIFSLISVSSCGLFLMLGIIAQYVLKIAREIVNIPIYSVQDKESFFEH